MVLTENNSCKVRLDDDIWYEKIPVGRNTIGNKMKDLSQEAKLSKTYTIHCLRVAAITLLDKSGFEARDIMSVSGHKSESSIRSYSRTDETTKRKMSNVISHTITKTTEGEDEDGDGMGNLNVENHKPRTNLSDEQAPAPCKNLSFRSASSPMKSDVTTQNLRSTEIGLKDSDLLAFTDSQEKVLFESLSFSHSQSSALQSTSGNIVNNINSNTLVERRYCPPQKLHPNGAVMIQCWRSAHS